MLIAKASPFSVVTKTEGKNRITPKRVLKELSVAFRAKIIPTVMTCFPLLHQSR